jgi:glycine cleavage system transcriptional repressor
MLPSGAEMAQLIITAVGPDRPGIVGELTAHLHAAGANLLESRMVNLRGEFAMMILLELPNEAAEKIAHELPATGERMKLRVSVTPLQSAGSAAKGMRYRLRTYSMDQPGIVARLTGVLRSHGVNIEELSARQESAAFAGSPLFLTEMRLTVPTNVPLGRLRAELEGVGNELNCDVDLDPAEG